MIIVRGVLQRDLSFRSPEKFLRVLCERRPRRTAPPSTAL
jgi:hypothetical protein